MGLVSADFAPVAAFTRPNVDKDGNQNPTPLGSNPVAVAERSRQAFMPRGLDRRAGDQFTYNGGKYTLAGRPRGDNVHPMTGDDLGWVAFDVEPGWTQVARGVQ